MNIGIPKERRPFEYRVGLSPAGAEILFHHGHPVFVEHEAGIGSGFSDEEYEKVGAHIVYSTDEVYGRADLILKVARPTDDEMNLLQPGSTLAGLLSLPSANQSKIDALLKNKITAVAYEQIRELDGSLPVLRPFSQIGGAMAAEVAARSLHSDQGGRGILLEAFPGCHLQRWLFWVQVQPVLTAAGVYRTRSACYRIRQGYQRFAANQPVWCECDNHDFN